MSNVFNNDYEDRLLTDGTAEAEEEVFEPDVEKSDESDEYYELHLAIRSRSLIWSVISFVSGVLSLALCAFWFVGLVFAAGAIVTSLISRKNLGFFEKYAIIGLVLGMMGTVCGVFSMVAASIGIF